jgi:hypothetical protein
VAARIKVLLLKRAGVGETAGEEITMPLASESTGTKAVSLPGILWHDPDVRWLCGMHETEGHTYLVAEEYQELLWWLLLPTLLHLAGDSASHRSDAAQLSLAVKEALNIAAEKRFRVDTPAEVQSVTPLTEEHHNTTEDEEIPELDGELPDPMEAGPEEEEAEVGPRRGAKVGEKQP